MKRFHIQNRLPMMVLFMGVFFITSCKKDNAISAADELGTIESMENDAVADFAYTNSTDDALNIGMEENSDKFGFQGPVTDFTSPRMAAPQVNGRVQRCYTVTIDTTEGTTFPITVTIDFKDGCVGRDGKLRKGKIITEYTGRLRVPGKKATTTFQEYSIDSIQVEGTHIMTNVSRNEVPAYRREIINGKLSWSAERWIKWSSVRTIAMINGADTYFDRRDDVFRITGEGRGENSAGKTWAHEITEGLIKRTACRWISSGIIGFRHNAAVGSLNYGDGDCDSKAILTVNDRSREINLR